MRSQDEGLRGPSIHPAEGHNSRGLVLTPYGSNATLTVLQVLLSEHFHSISLTLFLYEQVSPDPGEDSIIIHTHIFSALPRC
jgi:hypothetical protein